MNIEDLLPTRNPSSKDRPSDSHTNDGTDNNHNNKSPWLGRVRLLATEEHSNQEYTATVAVWTDKRENFDHLLHTIMVSRHLKLLSCESAMPAVKWLYHYPNDYAALELARGVHQNWPIAFGERVKIDTPATNSLPAEPYLSISQHEITPLPEQKGTPFWEKEWIVPELRELLFSQPESGPKLNTYFIVDASLHKAAASLVDLENIDVPIECLFKGEAEAELEAVAPYLIDMTLAEGLGSHAAEEDKDQIPNFHKDFFSQLWSKGTGIFIRTSASFDEVSLHFRKFPYLQVENDQRWVYLRFWDPRITSHYFASIQTLPKKVAQWININSTAQVHSLVGYLNHDKEETDKSSNDAKEGIENKQESQQAWCIKAKLPAFKSMNSAGTPRLSAVEIDGFKQQKRQDWADEFIAHLKNQKPFYNTAIGDAGLRATVRLGIHQAAKYGFTQRDSVSLYIHLMLYLGSYFDSDPLLPWAQHILSAKRFEQAQENKANTLRQALLNYLQANCGNQGQYLQRFIQCCQQQHTALNPQMSNHDIYRFIQRQYPEKYRYTGSELLHQVIEAAQDFCRQHQLKEGRSVFYLSCLRLICGSKFTEDPLYPEFASLCQKGHNTHNHNTHNKDAEFATISQAFFRQISASASALSANTSPTTTEGV